MKENDICIGDFVKVRDTGRAGEVLEKRGRSLLVAFRTPAQEEAEKVLMNVSCLERIEMPELDSETVRSVVRGEADVIALAQGLDEMLLMRSDAVYIADPEDLLAGVRRQKGDLQAAKLWLDQLLFWCDETCEGSIWPEFRE